MPTSSSRKMLTVPFAQKEKAKALGARWDPQQRCWWIPSEIDPAPFARWIPFAISTEPLYRTLGPVEIDEDFFAYVLGRPLEVFFIMVDCWKCHLLTLAFLGVVDRTNEASNLLYQANVIERLNDMRIGFGLERFGCVKPRSSKTLQTSYVSQGCSHCDALIGDFPLGEHFNHLVSTTDLSSYPYRESLDWSLLRLHRRT